MENPPNSWIISIPETRIHKKHNDKEKGEEEEAERPIPDWSDPGIDILEMVIRRLGPIDNLRFGGVCRQWRLVRFANRACLALHWPLLMYPSFAFSNCRRFLSPSDGRRYKISLCELFAETCLGSSGSWLVMRGRQLHLFNPFTLKKLKLPYIEEDPLEQAFSYKVPLLILSRPNSPDFAAVIFYPQSFYYLRNGNRRWTSHGFYNANYYGRVIQAAAVEGKFYALTNRGRLAHIDLDRNPVLVWVEQAGSIEFDKTREHAYLVESNAKLVVVIAKCQRCDQLMGVQEAVRMLMLDETTFTWSEAEHLVRGRVFFLGRRGSMSLATGEQECTTARVYTAGDNSLGMLEFDEAGGRGSLCCVHHGRSTAVWVMPELLFRSRKQEWWAGFYAIISERVILGLILGLVVFELLLLLLPRGFIRWLPHTVMLVIENVLVWGPIWISFCIACNCFCRTLGR